MAVKIRLARGGQKKNPYYRIVVANNTAPRDGDFLEKVGTYNPMLEKKDNNRVTLVKDRVDYWLSKGAKPTDRVAKFLAAAGINLPEHIKKEMAIKVKSRTIRKPKKERPEKAAKVEEAPVADAAPETPTPVVEAPVVEAPVEAPVAEAPAAEAPVSEEAKVEEVPAVEEAKVEPEAPVSEEVPVEAPVAETSAAEEAKVEEKPSEESSEESKS
jgi:small subunit ribosomal protein S16